MDSTPPATNRSPSPATIAWQADTIAESPDAHSRLTVTPLRTPEEPASRADMRATFRLSSPAWFAQPRYTSSISVRVDPGALDSGDRSGREVVGPDAGERAAVPPDRGAHGRQDDCAAHATRRGRRTSSPSQFGQTPASSAVQGAQNVHSYEQMYASPSGATAVPHRSQFPRSSSAIEPKPADSVGPPAPAPRPRASATLLALPHPIWGGERVPPAFRFERTRETRARG